MHIIIGDNDRIKYSAKLTIQLLKCAKNKCNPRFSIAVLYDTVNV